MPSEFDEVADDLEQKGHGGGGALMRAAYYVHGAMASCMPSSAQLTPESKQLIRRWIVRVDDALNASSSTCMDVFIPVTEEVAKHSN